MHELLSQPLTAERVHDELIPALAAHQDAREGALGDGPGTLWLRERMTRVAQRVAALPAGRVAVVAGLDDAAALTRALEAHPDLAPEPAPRPSADDAVRRRAFLDYAMLGDVEDVPSVVRELRAIGTPEARYHEANLLLARGRREEALATLEAASTGDFGEPYFLPGFLLSRLGQLYDLAGRRDAARRAYRGALALSYAPPEALAAAEAGLAAPFDLPAASGGEPGRGPADDTAAEPADDVR